MNNKFDSHSGLFVHLSFISPFISSLVSNLESNLTDEIEWIT